METNKNSIEYLKEAYTKKHEAEETFCGGYTIREHVPNIIQLIGHSNINPNSILDYGCGKGLQYSKYYIHHYWGADRKPTMYDFGVAEFATKPSGRFDLVLCTDVMEHVPEECVDEILSEVFSYARIAVYLSISTKPATKHLPDGRNVHLCVQDREWWWKRIRKQLELRERFIYTKLVFNEDLNPYIRTR